MSTFSLAFIVYRLFHGSCSDQHEMISYCGFDVHFSNNDHSPEHPKRFIELYRTEEKEVGDRGDQEEKRENEKGKGNQASN